MEKKKEIIERYSGETVTELKIQRERAIGRQGERVNERLERDSVCVKEIEIRKGRK